jgi:hypothetical protein
MHVRCLPASSSSEGNRRFGCRSQPRNLVDAIIATADDASLTVEEAQARIGELQRLYECNTTRDHDMVDPDRLLVCKASAPVPGIKPLPGRPPAWWLFREIAVWPEAPPLTYRDLAGALADVFEHLKTSRTPTNVTVTSRTEASWSTAPLPETPIAFDAMLHGTTQIILCPESHVRAQGWCYLTRSIDGRLLSAGLPSKFVQSQLHAKIVEFFDETMIGRFEREEIDLLVRPEWRCDELEMLYGRVAA